MVGVEVFGRGHISAGSVALHFAQDAPNVVWPGTRERNDRNIANRRIFPAIDLTSSSTRRDDLLLDEKTVQRMWVMRKYLADMNPVEAMEFINDRFKQTLNNEEFLISMNG